MSVLKYSRQREAIKNNLAMRKDHPTAEMVYESLKHEYPNLSLGTVYRNLALLSEIGEIQKLDGLGGSDHFDGRTDFHAHFRCESCGSVSDLENDDEIDKVIKTAGKAFSGKINSYKVNFWGVCEDCLRKI